MSLYYLMSQLPALDGVGDTSPIPITEERFYELARDNAGRKLTSELNALTLVPPRDGVTSDSELVRAWSENERRLRLALSAVRAGKQNKAFEAGDDTPDARLRQAAETALDMTNPLEAEQFLNRFRLSSLEELRPMDGFCEDAVLYYGLRLKLLLHMRRFDTAKGQSAYRNIYDSILRG